MLLQGAGAPSDILASFRDPMLNASAMHLKTLKTRLQVLQSELDSEIYTAISAATDRKVQNALLNVKRDVFNGRLVQKHLSLNLLFLQSENMALLFQSFDNLRAVFSNKNEVEAISENVWSKRKRFSFDYHVDDLIDFFDKIISKKCRKSVDERTTKIAIT